MAEGGDDMVDLQGQRDSDVGERMHGYAVAKLNLLRVEELKGSIGSGGVSVEKGQEDDWRNVQSVYSNIEVSLKEERRWIMMW